MKQKIIDFWNNYKTKKWVWVAVVAVVIIVLVVVIKKKPVDDGSVAVVANHDVVQSVVLSGRTQSGSAVDLNFADSGRVASVPVTEGDHVKKGQLLASLENGELNAQLTIAKAELANTNTNLDNVMREQNALVDNAYRALLSDGIGAVSEDLSTDITPPVITGAYHGAEGSYIIETYPSKSNSGYAFYVSGLEPRSTGVVAQTAVPLGTRGLFISFPSNQNYGGTKWIVEIPNKRSANYVANYNAYQSAVATHDRVIAAAQSDVAASGAQVSIAQARVDAIVAQIAKRKIVAPFDGVVANVTVKSGENASTSIGSTGTATSAVTLISENDYEVLLKAPEVDIAKLSVGQHVDITLGAYSDQVFSGTIVSINPAETIIDGVPVYETKVVFDKSDMRIRSGMTATATIIAAKRDAVIAVPANFIHTDPKDKNTAFVYVFVDDKKTEKRIVQTGLRGSDSFVEITSGLTIGEKIRVSELK